MESSQHFKMYKKGKQWCTMALASVMVGLGALATTQTTANADTTTTTDNSVDTTQTSDTSNDVQTNSVTLQSGSDSTSASNVNTTGSDNSSEQSSQSNSNSNSTVHAPLLLYSVQTNNDSTTKNGVVSEDGSNYYYVNGQKQTDYFYTNDSGQVYQFGDDGKMYQDQFYSNWGNMYYFGEDGARYTDQFYSNWGNMYYFGDDGVRYTNQFYSNWGNVYYFGEDGVRYTNQFYSNWGNLYYFGEDGARYTNQFYSNWGNTYYFGEDGVRYTNQFYSNWGNLYYFGDDGVRLDNGFYYAWGNVYYFKNDGARATNETVSVDGVGDLYFDNDGVLAYDASGTSQNEFISSIVNGAIEGWVDYGVLPSLTIAQAIIESAWGKSSLSATYHNLFGIKAGSSWTGATVNMSTGEYYNGSYTTIVDAFRAYSSNNDSVKDHSLFLVNNSRYSNLLWDKSSDSVTAKIYQDGYATSPTYTSTLRNVISNYGLTVFDQVAFKIKDMGY